MNTRHFLAALLMAALTAPIGAAYAKDLVFSAPPREAADKGQDIYGPIADELSKALGRKVVYKHPGNWLTYQFDMQKDKYDIVFDGPHFVSWRMAAHQHEPLVKLPGQLKFYVVVREDSGINDINQLSGRMVCGLAPPNLATLTVQAQFPNISRQPLVREVKSFKQAYQTMRAGVCQAAVLPKRWYSELVDAKSGVRTIFESRGVANQAFTASKRLSDSEKLKIAQLLLAPESKPKFDKFLETFAKGKDLEKASVVEYTGHASLLKDVWGFGLALQNGYDGSMRASLR